MEDNIRKPKVLFLYNPSSGKGKVHKNISYIEKVLKEKYGIVDIVGSKSKEHFEETVKNACYSYDYLFFSGGDGTFNMLINCIPDIKNLPIFGFLPSGSTNDMSYNLNLPRHNVKKGINDLINSKPKKYNIGFAGNKRFCYVLDCGTLMNVSHKCPKEAKRKFGVFAYVYYVFKYIFKVQLVEIEINGIKYKTPYVVISNSREVAHFKVNPYKEQNDGMYYAVIVKNGIFKGLLNVARFFVLGYDLAKEKGVIEVIESKFFQVNTKETHWDMDGEETYLEFPLSCGYSSKSIQLLVNRE